MPYSCDYTIFEKGNPYTIGMELEVRLVERGSMKPANSSPYIFEHIPQELSPYVHKELLQSMIEIVTPVCKDANEAVDFIIKTLRFISKIGEKRGISLAALATHPFEKKEDNIRFDDPRYDAFAQELQIILKNFLISGLHIHVAVPSAKSAIDAYNAVIKYMPIFLALSASSPFHLSEDTGLHSYRSEIFERLPRAGVPQQFRDYEEYCELMMALYKTGTIASAKDVWWDVRIHQQFGTVEMRICDAFYDKDRLRLIGLFYRMLIKYFTTIERVDIEFQQIHRQNKWNAVRHGLNGNFLDRDGVVTIRQKAHELIDKISKASNENSEDIDELHQLIDKETISEKMRRVYNESGNFKKVIEEELIV